MRILLKFVLDCDANVAWDAIRSPSVLKDVSFPLASFTSLEHGGFPARFPEGDHLVAVRSFGIDVGRKVVSISYRRRKDGVRMMRDSGHAVSGPLSLITKWQHTLTVTPTDDGKTLYRDQLVFSAGLLTLLVWLDIWVFWQWRGMGLRRLAPYWN
jgi:hypothetical protein